MPEQPISVKDWRELIGKGKLEECLEQVVDCCGQFHEFANQSRNLLHQYNDLKSDAIVSTQTSESQSVRKNQISEGLLELLSKIEACTTLAQKKVQHAPISKMETGFRESLKGVLPREFSNLQVLSKGDYNIVYKATRYAGTEQEDEVAIKALKNISLIEDESAKDLEHKFSLAKKYSNKDGIVTIHSSYMQVFPQFYVMRFIRGLDLDDYLEQDWPINLDEKRRILGRIAEALRQGHQDDLWHLNLRPSNVKIDLNGDPQLLPFQIIQFSFNRRNIKRIKKLITYWSPEQINGGDLCAQTDQYSLGLIAYELFTRQTLFEGDTVLDIIQKRFEIQQSIENYCQEATSGSAKKPKPDFLEKELLKTDCPPLFIDTIRQMLRKEAENRFLDMDEIIIAIEDHIRAKTTRVPAIFRSLEKSFDKCRKQEQFYTDFYDAFFSKKPSYQALFEEAFLAKEKLRIDPEDDHETFELNEQQKNFRWQFQHRMLDLAIERMLLFHEKAPKIKERMARLGRSHQSFGLKPKDFSLFLDCMKETLQKADPKSWPSPETIDPIWAKFVAPILTAMKKKS